MRRVGEDWLTNKTGRRVGVLFIGIAVAVAIFLIATISQWSEVTAIAATFTSVSLVAIGIRYLCMGVSVDAEGLKSRGEVWTRRIKWSDLNAFEARGFIVGAKLKNGKWLPMFFAQRIPLERDELVTALTAKLRSTQ